MGRGNVCVHNEYEGLYYIDWDNFSKEYEDSNGNIIEDDDFQRSELENALEEFCFDFKEKYPSFYDSEGWIDHSQKILLENSLFYIVVEDNESSVAIELLQKEQDYYKKGNIVGLQAGLYKKYLEGMKQCLFNQFDELGIYCGPWTSGIIYKNVQ